MRFPKLTRERIRLAGGKPVEILWPAEREPKIDRRYTIQASHKAARDSLTVIAAAELPNGGWRVMVRLDADPIRLLGTQVGYTDAPARAIRCFTAPTDEATSFRPEYEPEAVDEFTQRQQTRDARERLSDQKKRDNEDLFTAMNELKGVLDGMGRDRRRALGRTLWVLRSRLDAAERDLRRREAA